MNIIISIFAIFALAFLVKESDGPWGLIGSLRNALMRIKYFGVFIYKLLDCWFCTGMHAGWAVYLLQAEHYKVQDFVLWSLAGGAVCLAFSAMLNKLNA
jgi:hypothetical protein